MYEIIKILFDTHRFEFPIDTYEIRKSKFTGKLMVKMKGINGQVKIVSEDEYIPFLEPDYYSELQHIYKNN